MNRFQMYLCSDEVLRWRFMGGNNRVIALSPFPFTSAEQGREHVQLVRRSVDVNALTVTLDRADDGWAWRLDGTTSPAAVGAAPFARKADAQAAARRFLRCAGAAQLVPDVVAHRVNLHPLSLCGRPIRDAGRDGAVTST